MFLPRRLPLVLLIACCASLGAAVRAQTRAPEGVAPTTLDAARMVPPLASDVIDGDVLRRLAESGKPVQVWIFLADKGFATPVEEQAALAGLAASFDARSLVRRTLRRTAPGLFDARDLPVASKHADRITELGVVIHARSRWLNAVSAIVDAEQLAALAELPFVANIRLVGRTARPVPGAPRRVTSDASASDSGPGDGGLDYGSAQGQLELINLPALHATGATGAGVVIGVLDTGFATTHTAFQTPGHELDVIAAWDFVDDDSVVGPEPADDPGQHFHGTLILGELAAYLPGTLVGAAFDASFILCKTEDITSETQVEEDYYVAGLEFIEANGGDVATSSLGYIDWYVQADLDGQSAVTTVAVNIATANGLHCCTAAGNSGNDADPLVAHLIAPADALDVLTCGAVDIAGQPASFTSDGPTADGRTKPEVMAQGVDTYSIWPYDDVSLSTASGTSLATPLLAGVVACLVQAHPEWSVGSIRDRVLKSADAQGLPAPDPLSIYGWGIVDALAALNLSGTFTVLGGATAGSNGLPDLTGSGTLLGTEPLTLTLINGKPNGSASLVIGASALNAPFKGGLLVPTPSVVLAGLPLNGAGALALSGPFLPGLPGGLELHFQFWIPDAAATAGFAASNAVRGTTP